MYINKNVAKSEIIKILNSYEGVEAAGRVLGIWDSIITKVYDDGIHDLDWFSAKARDNKVLKNKNSNLSKPWADCVIKMQNNCEDIVGVLEAVEYLATMDAILTDGKNLLERAIEQNDLVTASFVCALQQGGSARFPSDNDNYEKETSPIKKGNTIFKALNSSPEMMKMILCFFPKNCSTEKNIEITKKELQEVLKTCSKDDRARIEENCELYNQFLQERGLRPAFAKEDSFENTAAMDKQVVNNVRAFVENVMQEKSEKEQSELKIGEDPIKDNDENTIYDFNIEKKDNFETQKESKQDHAIERYAR